MNTLRSVGSTLSSYSTLISAMLDIGTTIEPCPANCSGRGVCIDGICTCEVQYAGWDCTESNLSYHVAFGCIFFLLCVVSVVQLALCIKAEFTKLEKPSLAKAFRVTTQKLLYGVIIIATFSRGVYFSVQEHIDDHWANSLQAAYYPVLITGMSLIVCFWAEAFHLEKDSDKPGFLSKSFAGFIIFNVFIYVLLTIQFITVHFSERKDYLMSIFVGCYAVLMLLCVVFFLVYGVEVYFKVRGAFATASPTFNITQLHQSRFGLVSQAILQIVAAFFLILNVTSALWKDRIPITSWNLYNVVFRTVEIGLVLWFPCVLWNWERPDKLWILNPRRLFRRDSGEESGVTPSTEGSGLTLKQHPSYDATAAAEPIAGKYDCWICYDPDRTDAGALIQPCRCKGDVATVHHDCLQKWLIESIDNPDNLQCKVCKVKYEVREGRFVLMRGFDSKKLVQTGIIVSVMIIIPIGVYCICVKFPNSVLQVVSVGVCLMAEYICLRCLGFGIVDAYKRAKVSALRIVGQRVEQEIDNPNQRAANVTMTTVDIHPINS